jgi:KH domain
MYHADGAVFMLQVSVLVEQESQRPILLGKQGSQLKKLATDSRHAIEEFLGECIFSVFSHMSLAYSVPTCFSQADGGSLHTLMLTCVCNDTMVSHGCNCRSAGVPRYLSQGGTQVEEK